MDLARLGRGLSWRKFQVLLVQMPRESRFVRALRPSAAWTTTDYLLAQAVDALNASNWQRGGGKGGRPKPIKRPGTDDAKRYGKAVPMSQARALLDKWNRGEVTERHGSRVGNRVRQHRSLRTELR